MDGFIRADQLDSARDTILDVSLVPRRKKIFRAVTYAPQEILAATELPNVSREHRVAVYGDSQFVARAVVEHLARIGYVHAALLEGGFESWHDFGMPLVDR